MKKNVTYSYSWLLIGIVGVMFLASCRGEEDPVIGHEQMPIAFSSVTAEEESMTRAATPLARDFRVYGYKNVGGSEQVVFDRYDVRYQAGSANTSEDNTHGYYYVHGNQTIKYWDFSASEYNFWGATKALIEGKGSFNSDGTVLTISGLEQSVIEPAENDDQLFSALYHRSPVSTDVVQLQFKRPYAEVRVLFYTNVTLTDQPFDNIKITDITFGPESPNEIITGGSLQVTYPKKGEGPETYATTPTASTGNLSFGNVQLDHDHGTASNNAVIAVPTDGTEWYYTLPVSDGSPAIAFTLNATIDNEARTAVVPSNFMQWKPNFAYTYIFKISGGKYMEFYDVQIDPWKYGGGQEVEWKNW